MAFDFSTLVTDRTMADVLARNNKGTYNAADLNRVDACLEDLVARLGRVGCNVPGYERVKIPRETKPAKEENFRYLRIIVNALRGNTTVFQVSEIKILSKSGESMPWPAETLVTSTMEETSEAESPKKLIDGSVETKFCSVHFSTGAQIDIDLKSNILDRKEYTSWQWFTANDSPERDPVSFELQGSVDGSDFLTLDLVTNASITTTRNILAYTGKFQEFEPEQPPVTLDPYTWYESDVPTASQMAQYRGNVAAVRAVLQLREETPELPSTMEQLTTAGANNIEAVLLAVDLILTHIPAAVRHCGVTVCGSKGVIA